MTALLRQYFSEQTQGFADGILLLDMPAPVQQEPELREEEMQLLKDSVAYTSKKRAFQLVLLTNNDKTKLFIARNLSEQLGNSLCFVDCSVMAGRDDGDKILSRLISDAQSKHWILFFDEADSLFGKRTEVNDAHDKFANLETSYLLQLLSDYAGLVVFSSRDDTTAQQLQRRFKNLIRCN